MAGESPDRRDDRSPQRGSRWRSRSRSPRREYFRGRRRSPPRSPGLRCGGSESPRDRSDEDGNDRGYRGNGGRGGGGTRDNGRGRGRRPRDQDDFNQGGKELWGKPGELDDKEEQLPEKEPEPNFGLSGALAAETNTVK
jgi:smad nuclear-interacting protein 1